MFCDTGADTSFIDSATAKQLKIPFKQLADRKGVINLSHAGTTIPRKGIIGQLTLAAISHSNPNWQ